MSEGRGKGKGERESKGDSVLKTELNMGLNVGLDFLTLRSCLGPESTVICFK